MDTLQNLIFVIILGQCFGLLPLEITKRKNVHFKWMSFKTLYTIICMGILIINTFMYLYNTFKASIKFGNIGKRKTLHVVF